MKSDEDANKILIAELKIAWHQRMLYEVTSELDEWWDIDSEEVDFLDNLCSSYNETFLNFREEYEDDYYCCPRETLDVLEEIFTAARKLCECRKLHAWEIKPCWAVYEKLAALTDKLVNQSVISSPDRLARLENTLAVLSANVTSIKYELGDIEDFIDLTDKDRAWFKEIANRLDEIAMNKSGHLYDGLYALYGILVPVRKYIECQGSTNKERCLHEVGELCKKIGNNK